MRQLLVLLSLFLNSISYACINEVLVNKSGKSTIDFPFGDAIYYKSHNIYEIESRLKILQNDLLTETDNAEKSNIQNDIAVQYIKLKKYNEAEKILNSLLKKNPNSYSVVVNLGTLYELQGKNKLSLDFIKKAIAINPDSHDGSEWFHVKILEFKLKNINPNQKINKEVLYLNINKQDAINIATDIEYQLQERIPFTAPPNVMIAKILQEYGDFLADSISIKAAYLIYDLGKEYDTNNYYNFPLKIDSLLPYFKKYDEAIPVLNNHYLDPIIQHVKDSSVQIATSLLDKGFNYFKEKEAEKVQRKNTNSILIYTSLFIALFAGGFFFWKKKRKPNEI
jgi:tetratricopeptide (TPR) repeat protein